ncbi:nucleotidyltransferase domain-containing protein, partial [Parvibaculum sp.]|uniref:nucleotidyltransferase domain-containing protein n=1 Tax=Parvibaculum sp. TaxID=2024848 RepID=UPI0032970682
MAQTADQRIREMLSDISQNEGVDILYAIESGSRAWGFESPDSDYVVRFIYREPAARAFALRPPRNVIEVTQPLEAGDGQSLPVDMVGWSLSKAIGLGLASNPQFAEWSRISEHYVVDQEFHDQMREIASHSSPRALAHHYRGLAKKTMHEYLNRDEDPVGKKYLYAVRPIMAAQWMLDNPHVGVTPPVPFEDLRKEVQVHR